MVRAGARLPASVVDSNRPRAVTLDRGIETSPPLPGDCGRDTAGRR